MSAKFSEFPLGLTYDDVLLKPRYSEVLPGETKLPTRITRDLSLEIPLVSAAMDTVTEAPMAVRLARSGGIGFIHKNASPQDQAQQVADAKKQGKELLVGAAVGASDVELERCGLLLEAGADIIVIDTAHGHSKGVIEMVKKVRKNFVSKKFQLVAGNVATAEGAIALADAGVDAVKVGIGPGSICTTRIVAGIGVPQLSAVLECSQALEARGIPVIADGGIKFSGDIVKALAAGAECVMIGNLFAGTDESPGEVASHQGQRFKYYRGMGSIGAMVKGSKDRYFQSDVKEHGKLVPEGVEGRVAYKGPVDEILFQLIGGIKQALGYVGAHNLKELREKATFVRISPAGFKESHVHNVTITREAPNYSISQS